MRRRAFLTGVAAGAGLSSGCLLGGASHPAPLPVRVVNETDRRQTGTLSIIAPEETPGYGMAVGADGDTVYEMAFDLGFGYTKEQTDLTGVEYTVEVSLETGREHRAEWRWQGCRDDAIVTEIHGDGITAGFICAD